MRRFIMLILFVTVIMPVASQAPDTLIPIESPYIAINTVEQDAIILYDVNNNTYRELSLGARNHHVWDTSPDGCELLVTVRDGTAPARLIALSLDGTQSRDLVQVTDLAPQLWGVWEPDWNHTTDQIAFTLIRQLGDERNSRIALVSSQGGEPQFYSVTGSEATPLWSPNGGWLVYASYSERVAGADVFSTAVPTLEPPPGQTPPAPVLLNESDLWLVSADGEEKYQLTNFRTGSVTMPRWSPDSEIIAFVHSPSGNNDTIWIVGSQRGALPTQLSFNWVQALDLTWLPDGTHIIGALRDMRDIPNNRLWQIPLVGNADQSAFEYLSELNINSADYPRFSADGRFLATRSAYDLLLIDTQTGDITPLSDRTFGNSPVVWSPANFAGESSC